MGLLKWSPGRRAILEDEQKAYEWLSSGWVIKEMQLKRDGKTTDKLYYRMGYRLFALQQQRPSDVPWGVEFVFQNLYENRFDLVQYKGIGEGSILTYSLSRFDSVTFTQCMDDGMNLFRFWKP